MSILTKRADGAIGHWCQGCRALHYFDNNFTWDGDEQTPTFYPDHLTNSPISDDVCHYTIVIGVITYLSRTSHALRGQRIPLESPPADTPPTPATIDAAMNAIADAMRNLRR
jgi:hypothetical protein